MTEFDTITACGECCVGCSKKLQGICPGCNEAEGRVPEWAESGVCRVYACCKEHNARFCGLCKEFPCEKLPGMIPWDNDIILHLTALRDEYWKQNSSISRFLRGKDVREIATGKSGADVYEIDKELILKHVKRSRIKKDVFDTYKREALFYKEECPRDYLPDVLHNEIRDDEIIILMRKLRQPERGSLDDELLGKIAVSLARIHNETVPDFLKSSDIKKTELLSEQMISECYEGWKSVLSEHPGLFEEEILSGIKKELNDLIIWHNTETQCLIHGDFHWDNILLDDAGDIRICDWQGVDIGGASGDLSFFMSRLAADGYKTDEKKFVGLYADAVRDLTGKEINAEDIVSHIKVSNVIISFIFWHQYLHGSVEQRVREIYDKMVADLKWGMNSLNKRKS